MLQSIHVPNCRLVEQILKCTPVVQTTAHLRHEFIRDVHSKTTALDPAVKNMAKVLFTFKASLAVLSDASGTAKTYRSQGRWPKAGNLFLKPIRNICGKFFFGWHSVYVPYNHIYSQVKSFNYFLCSNL
jgi:hypothetical protein